MTEQSQKLSALWKGHPVFAVDGTSLLLPATASVLDAFPRERRGDHYPKAKLICALNVFTGLPLWWSLGAPSGSERQALLDHLKSFPPNSIVLLDRGYEASYLWQAIHQIDRSFVARIRTTGYAARALLKSGKKESFLTIQTTSGSIRLRLIRCTSRTEPFVLITNLIQTKKYPRATISQLYKRRWEVETAYFRVKQYLHVQNWNSKTVHGIRLEIASRLLMLSLIAARVFKATLRLKNKLLRINFKNAIFVFRSALFRSISERELLQAIMSVTRVHQPGRSYPRYSRQPQNKWINLRRPSWQRKQRYNPERAFS